MKFLYDIIAVLVVIMAVPMFLLRMIREEGFGERLRQSFGFLPQKALMKVANRQCIWLHAASVGEIVAASPIVKEIRRELPDIPILVSTVTSNGYRMAQRIIPEAEAFIYFPLDLPGLSGYVLKRVRPRLFLLVETELWPNFLRSANIHHVPVMMVNGRISDRSVSRYRHLGRILQDMLGTVNRFCMQSTIDAQYIIRLGADPRKVVVTGNTKFDQTYTDISPEDRRRLLTELGLNGHSPVIVAGSTHPGEEELLYAAFQKVRQVFADARLIIAPRDTLRAAEIAAVAAGYRLRAVCRTQQEKALAGQHDVVILDTIGELGKIYSLGDIIFVGGSLIAHGGHNILEPAAHGKPIVVGPHMFNFKDSYALLDGRGALVTVNDGAGLTDKMLEILQNDDTRQSMGREALAIIQENRGAARKSVEYIKQLLETAEWDCSETG